MILNVKTLQPEIEGLTFYIYKQNKFMCLEIKDDVIMLFNEAHEGMQLKESTLHEILSEYFEKNF